MTRRKLCLIVVLFLLAPFTLPPAPAQETAAGGADQPLRAQKLAGSVHIAGQETMLSTVLIEECDPGWVNVLGSTHTDYQGHFSLKPATKKKLHYIRASAKGFETGMYHVILTHDGPPELHLALKLASQSQAPRPKRSPLAPAPARMLTVSLPARASEGNLP